MAAGNQVRWLPDKCTCRTAGPPAFTRRGHDWTHRFRSIAEAVGGLPAHQLILDGEVAVSGRGSGDFGALRADLAAGRSDRMTYHAFDLLYLDGFDIRAAPPTPGTTNGAATHPRSIPDIQHRLRCAARPNGPWACAGLAPATLRAPACRASPHIGAALAGEAGPDLAGIDQFAVHLPCQPQRGNAARFGIEADHHERIAPAAFGFDPSLDPPDR